MKAGLPWNNQPYDGAGMGSLNLGRAHRRQDLSLKSCQLYAWAFLWGLKRACFFAFAGLVALSVQAQRPVPVPSSAVPEKARVQGEVTVSQATPLSAWLLSQPSLDVAYPLGLVWTTPEEQSRQSAQQKDWLAQLELLRTQGRISAQTWLSMQRMMRSLAPTGRVRLAAADAQWLLANPRRDALVLPGDSLRLPKRPQTIRLLDEQGRACDVAHQPGALGRDYLASCWPDHRAERAWLVQPDGRIQQLGLRPWNPQAQDEPAPGGWLWRSTRLGQSGWPTRAFLDKCWRMHSPASSENLPRLLRVCGDGMWRGSSLNPRPAPATGAWWDCCKPPQRVCDQQAISA